MGCKVETPLKRCIIQVGLGNGHIYHHMKRLDHCLWLCRIARTTGIFPSWTGSFLRKKSGEFEGKIRLAHQLHKDTTVRCMVATPLKRCILQVGLGHGHIHNHMKRLDHCLWLCRMARATGLPPRFAGFVPKERSREFERKIRLAHTAVCNC